ncbi:MAG: hypothetical protein EOO38_31445, partial [Cytophagaceae bacterium]
MDPRFRFLIPMDYAVYEAARSGFVRREMGHFGRFRVWGKDAANLLHHLTTQDVKAMREMAFQASMNIQAIDKIFNIGSKDKIYDVVVRKDHRTAADMLRSERQPLKRLERLLRIMQYHELPNYDYLSNETNEVVQAVQYYNLRILPTVKAAGELAPNPAIILFPLRALHILPPAIHHTLVCLSLNHYVHSLPIGADKSAALQNRAKVYHHRGAAIQALS